MNHLRWHPSNCKIFTSFFHSMFRHKIGIEMFKGYILLAISITLILFKEINKRGLVYNAV